jgi:hypothetical protein
MHLRASDLARMGGCTMEYLPVLEGWWALVPIWETGGRRIPLRRWELAVAFPGGGPLT